MEEQFTLTVVLSRGHATIRVWGNRPAKLSEGTLGVCGLTSAPTGRVRWSERTGRGLIHRLTFEAGGAGRLTPAAVPRIGGHIDAGAGATATRRVVTALGSVGLRGFDANVAFALCFDTGIV